jgi:hypothetical protein
MARSRMFILDGEGTPLECTEDQYDRWAAFLRRMSDGAGVSGRGLHHECADMEIMTWFRALDGRRENDPPGPPLLWETAVVRIHRSGSEPVLVELHSAADAAVEWHHRALIAFKRPDRTWRHRDDAAS